MGRGTAWVLALGLAAVGLAVAWAFTPLRTLIAPRALLAAAEQVRASSWAFLLVPSAFIVLSLAMVPTSLLRWTTVVAFDPLFGIACMTIGILLASLVGHAIGDRLGADRMSRITSKRFVRIRDRLERTGVLGIAVLRQVPLGPFMIVNAAAGAAGVRRRVFLVGTLVGTVPSAVVMVILAGSLRAWLLG